MKTNIEIVDEYVDSLGLNERSAAEGTATGNLRECLLHYETFDTRPFRDLAYLVGHSRALRLVDEGIARIRTMGDQFPPTMRRARERARRMRERTSRPTDRARQRGERKNIMSNIWTDSESVETQGASVGFLILRESERGGSRYSLQMKPAHTNQSFEPRLEGWCGTTDNVATYAMGLARMSRVAANGRVRLERVPATPELLEELGYPELAQLPPTMRRARERARRMRE